MDAIVRCEGELTFLELVQRIAAEQDWHGVHGLSFKAGGAIVHEPGRPVTNINDLPAPAYDLVDHGIYTAPSGIRQLSYTSSVGCPYQCNYCTDQVFYKRRFNAYRAERVVSELAELVPRYDIQDVPFFDSNFLVDRKRALAIARGIVDSGVKFRWDFQASTDFVAKMTDDEVALLAESGVWHIGFGTESASQEVLNLMNKRFQNLEQMLDTARKTHRAGMHVVFNIILGYPGETEADRQLTFRVMSDIARQYWDVSFSPNIFTPYPGLPMAAVERTWGARAAVPRGMAKVRPRCKSSSVVAGRRPASAATQPGILSAEQPNPQGGKKKCVVAAGFSPGARRAGALAHQQEPLLIPVGAVGFPGG